MPRVFAVIRVLLALVLFCAIALGIAYVFAGRAEGPTITINQPTVVGQASTLDVTVEAPGGDLNALSITIDQNGRRTPLFALDSGPSEAVR